jgi:hypothetical protein
MGVAIGVDSHKSAASLVRHPGRRDRPRALDHPAKEADPDRSVGYSLSGRRVKS